MPLTYTRAARTKSARPRVSGGPTVFTRGPQELQRSLLGPPPQLYGTPPPTFSGSLPEWACLWGHQKLGLTLNVDYVYQANFAGGHKMVGGVVPDFLERDVPIAINIQGEYVHYKRGSGQIARDLATRDVLARYGIQLILIDDVYALADPIDAVKNARLGIDKSYASHPR
jgi:hypothetical protein